ncbi:MAG: hypothetical protein NC094_08925 [Bacteroidales bacterium]|nr:hypothetical protein [Lachnoclostridium sp.]MCM1385126.1 hypothetical protein [Lachnoclostridium sp.]MCM1465528.1 hypothetical protein [Bacteroidales bacterium]
MINAIIAAISVALNAEFGYENHMEEIKQGLVEPCFFIQCVNTTTELFLGRRYFKQNLFCIQYFPKGEEKQQECNEVAEKMDWCLEYITVDGQKMRATNMKHNVEDGVLNFFLNYDCFVYRMEADEAMETLDSTTNMKEGGNVGS